MPHTLVPGEYAFATYSDTTWFDRNWMFIGPFVGLVLFVYATVTKRYTVGSVGLLGWAAMLVYTTHQFEEHAYDAFGHRYSFIDFILGNKLMQASPRRITYINVLPVWTRYSLGALYYDLTSDPVIIFLAYVVCLSQMSHVVWAFAYPDVHGGPSYNPGLVQTIVLMVPLAIYAIRTIYHEHYIGVVFGRPKLALIAASHLALTALPWFVIPVTDGDYYLLLTQLFSAVIYPLLVARFIWPALRQCGAARGDTQGSKYVHLH
jgi:hypothetical protein